MRIFVVALFLATAALRGEEAVRLSESFPAGTRYQVKTRVELTGTLTPPLPPKGRKPDPVRVAGVSAIDYEERVAAVDPSGDVTKTVRSCARFDFRRTLAGQKQEIALRPGVKRLVVLRKGQTEVPFSPDGPLTWGEMDVVRTDVFVPALRGLLPATAVKEGDRWRAADPAVQELTDLEKVEEGAVECRLDRVTADGKRRLARVTFGGTVKGVGEDGPARHTLRGSYTFDLEGGYLAELILNGKMTMPGPDGKDLGSIEGRFALERSPGGKAADLDDEALKGVKLEPDDDNTRMLYASAGQGVSFEYPRAWRIAREADSQIALDGAGGSGLMITLDPPGKTPTSRQLLDESRGWMKKQKGEVTREVPAATLRTTPRLEAFSLEARLSGQTFWMDYYVTEQDAGGATVAARLVPAELAKARKDVEAIARSIVLSGKK
ncbi:MAG: hypothetical protein ACRC33_19575 [Gemmataceae bacterium]